MATAIPSNQAPLSLEQIVQWTGGERVDSTGGGPAQVRGVSTDTRALGPGQAFVALSGERFDGHEHLADAAGQGAVVALVEREVLAPPGLCVVRVGSTLTALGELARGHVAGWRGLPGTRRVIAITGSAGKTTTRVLLGAMLEALAPGTVCSAAGNLNNLVGTPMVALGLSDEHRHAVLELGTNQPGEIERLAEIVQPDVGVLTLIAPAHTERLGTVEGVAEEKTALYRSLGPTRSIAVGNVDDERVRGALARSGAERRIGYGLAEAASYRIRERRLTRYDRAHLVLARPDASLLELDLGITGAPGALAVAAAVATLETEFDRALDAPTLQPVVDRLGELGPSGRLRPRPLADGLLLIDDSYNANPASCRSSVATAAEIAKLLGRRLVLVLGEMRELGALAEAEHQRLGRDAAASGAEQLFAIGGWAEHTARAAARAGLPARFAADSAAAAVLVLAEVRPADVVLVKGSRAIGTEQIVEALAQAHDRQTALPPQGASRSDVQEVAR